MDNKIYLIKRNHNLAMDIEATIEDLEAQAYFASIGLPQRSQRSKVRAQVNLNVDNSEAFLLSMPLIGTDFLAGFSNITFGHSRAWLLIPNTAIQSFEILEGEIASNGESANNFLQNRLLGAHLRISTLVNSPLISGIVLGSTDGWLRLQLVSMRELYVPMHSVKFLAVEKISSLNKQSA